MRETLEAPVIRGVVFGLIITAPFWFILTAIPFLALGGGGGVSLIGAGFIVAGVLWVIAYYPPLINAVADTDPSTKEGADAV